MDKKSLISKKMVIMAMVGFYGLLFVQGIHALIPFNETLYSTLLIVFLGISFVFCLLLFLNFIKDRIKKGKR